MIRIDELPPALQAFLEQTLPAMKDDLTVQVTIAQVYSLFVDMLTEGAPGTLDTIAELAAALEDNADVLDLLVRKSANLSDVADKVVALLNLTTRNAANNDEGITLKNLDTSGYGAAIRFLGAYSGGYDFARIFAQNHATGGQLHFSTADAAKVMTERFRVDNAGIITLLNGTLFADPWAFMPIGVPIGLQDDHTTALRPSTTAGYRYVQLTAGLTGGGAYNNGVLTSESVTGSAPLVVATAVVSLAGSPLNAKTISLINSEQRFLRPGPTAGTKRNSQMQDHRHKFARVLNGVTLMSNDQNYDVTASEGDGGDLRGGMSGNIANDANVNFGTDTYPKHLEQTYFMRIK